MTPSPRIRDLAIRIVAAAILSIGLGARGTAAEPLPEPRESLPAPCDVALENGIDPAAVAVGAGGCATASCHGGPQAGNHDVRTFSAALWATRDPHSRAYETLHGPRSRRMAAMLGIGEPHRARQCLVCHASQAAVETPLSPGVLADGVACGSCHGDATRWLTVHTLPEWKHLDGPARAELGYRDLADVGARVRTCIPCHVGDASREVDHDLLAAGHPRLAFEFAAYERLWPRHWSPRGRAESQSDFAARSWAAGQAEVVAAVARLLAVRARRAAETAAEDRLALEPPPRARWPEFAEFDCYSCHRPLSPERVAAAAGGEFRNPAPGTPSWQPWTTAAASLLSAAVAEPAVARVGPAAADLRDALRPAWSSADQAQLIRVITRAELLEQAADAAARGIAAQRLVTLDASPERLDTLVFANRPEWRSWDAAAQTYLLMEAAAAPSARGRAALDSLRNGLRFPPGAGGPDRFDQIGRAHV